MSDSASVKVEPDGLDLIEACIAVVGADHVLTQEAATEPYVVDFWRQYRGVARLVVRPGTTEEVSRIVKLAAHRGISIVPQSGNTGLVNGGIPDGSGRQLLLSLRRLNRIRKVDPTGDYVIAEAGCILADVQAAAEAVDRLFPLSLGAEGSCQIGGNLSTNAGGLNVLRYGMARDLVLGLEVVLADGSVLDVLRPLRKDNAGYDLKQLFIGCEGTLGIITAAVLRLSAAPREHVTVWLSLESPNDAVRLFHRFRTEFGDLISSFELLEAWGVEAVLRQIPSLIRPVADEHPWHLLIELSWTFTTGLRERVEPVLEALFTERLCRDGTIAESEQQRLAMWRIRENQSEATRHYGDIIRSDVSVPIGDIPVLIATTQGWVRSDMPKVMVLTFGHIGDGNLHLNFIVPLDRSDALRPILLGRLYDDVTALGGSISAEHGVGRAKRDAVAARKPAVEAALMRHLKFALDPRSTLNPNVVIPT